MKFKEGDIIRRKTSIMAKYKICGISPISPFRYICKSLYYEQLFALNMNYIDDMYEICPIEISKLSQVLK